MHIGGGNANLQNPTTPKIERENLVEYRTRKSERRVGLRYRETQ